MDADPLIRIQPPEVLEIRGNGAGNLQNLIEIWETAEAFTSPDLARRSAALDRLLDRDALRSSALVAYLCATRLLDPDIHLRARVVRAVAEGLSPDEHGQLAPEAVRSTLAAYLSTMRTRPIQALLQVVDFDRAAEPQVARLLSCCSFAGGHLADILANRDTDLAVRKQAAFFIGRIGYLDALPTLERLANRLETRLNGSGLIRDDDETALLPLVRDALAILRAP